MSDIDCIRVKRSDNGFLIINYTVKTKSTVGSGNVYSNVDYNDKEEVFGKDDKEEFTKRIFSLMGMEAESDSDEAES